MKYWNDNPPFLVGREISTLSVPLYMWRPVIAGINLFQIVFLEVAVSGGLLEWFSGSS